MLNEHLVLVCEHHHNDLVFFRYEWPRLPSAPSILILETGTEALAFLKKCSESFSTEPSLVICEWELPYGSGLEILTFIKTSRSLQHIPVIMTAEVVTPENRRQALEAGALDCWQKPFSFDALEEILQHLSAFQH